MIDVKLTHRRLAELLTSLMKGEPVHGGETIQELLELSGVALSLALAKAVEARSDELDALHPEWLEARYPAIRSEVQAAVILLAEKTKDMATSEEGRLPADGVVSIDIRGDSDQDRFEFTFSPDEDPPTPGR